MRLAFVVRLGADTRPSQGLFEGWIEEVDSCAELRFRSTEEMLKFLGERFDLAMPSTEKARDDNRSKQAPVREKSPCKEKRTP